MLAPKKIGILNKLKHVLSLEIKTLLYNSLILPHINYCITAWGFQPGRILKLQTKTVISITLSKYNSHSDPIFKRLDFLKVDDLLKLQQLKLYYNYSHYNVPIYFQKWKLFPNCDVHKHDTRNKHELYTYRIKHEFAKKCLRHNLPLILNNNPHTVKDKISTHSMQGFVQYVKHHLLRSYRETCTISNCYTCMHNNYC